MHMTCAGGAYFMRAIEVTHDAGYGSTVSWENNKKKLYIVNNTWSQLPTAQRCRFGPKRDETGDTSCRVRVRKKTN